MLAKVILSQLFIVKCFKKLLLIRFLKNSFNCEAFSAKYLNGVIPGFPSMTYFSAKFSRADFSCLIPLPYSVIARSRAFLRYSGVSLGIDLFFIHS